MSIKNDEKVRFNVADVVIILIFIMIIAALALRIYGILTADETKDNVLVEFEVSGISSEHIYLNKNDKLYSVTDNAEVGYIVDFTVEETSKYTFTEDGELVKAIVPGKSTVKGKMVLTGVSNENGFFLDGKKLLTESKDITLYTASRELLFKIVKIGV